ncbi:hypothetical protein M406DRAFT_96027 [Cryphonectria parasitica EP155]|uniref:Carrier domain-containing protein n=1 Tax=Cryphonectria parasitica (strain ATCC 38755 / EP155) TaxID=660469 RepID=A0A9P4YB32_CRYP1|nr:uncharacterized protein M406DRAFT_96027 [Cryphonectria parasitica EP155]KAF3769380.1 hypothetical protein M406DRAFT_96027 [Cryphonectria parasitica EP155]
MASQVGSTQTELWPQIVDRLAREQPSAPYGLWPVATDSYNAGFRTITYSQLATIVDNLAWWIARELGPRQGEAGVLTYVGPNDVRLTAMIIAAVKANHVLFLTSPRNSPAAQQSMFSALNCKTLVTTDPKPPSVLPILESIGPRCLTVPAIDDLLAVPPSPFAYEKPFEAGRWDPLFVLHTSGSTGIPKPLIWTQESCVRHHACASQAIPNEQGLASVEHILWGKRVIVTVPSFHGAGILQYMCWAVCAGCIPIAPAAVGIVTASGLAEALKHTPAEVAILVPSVVADLAQHPHLLTYCAGHLKLILYIGGDLPQAVGNIVAAQIPLRCWWGASEVGIPHQLIPAGLSSKDWRYVRFHPSVGAVFDPISDDTYELVIRRDETLAQVSFTIRGQEGLKEYRTKDLFQPHPTVPDAWCWRSRSDDIIVLLNGEKTNPVSMEQHIVAHNHELAAVLVVGTRRFQTALLIEPAALAERGPLSTSEQAALIERVWPSVQEANAVAPAHARVEKALILVLDRPVLRAGKGTIQRASSVEQFSAEIEALYANADVITDDENRPGEASWDLTDAASIARFIQETVSDVTGWPAPDQAETAETFFDRGMDSLMALQLVRRLRHSLQRPELSLSTVYSNPTVSQLSHAITAHKTGQEDSDASQLEPMLKTYRALIEQIPKPKMDMSGSEGERKKQPLTVVLTGSTGTVGTFLLRALLDRPEIGRVYCLNRSEDGGQAIQKARMAERGLELADLGERATFLQADLRRPLLGLDEATYERLRSQVGLVVHNAWPVNFNLGLTAFRPELVGLVNLLHLCAAASPERTASFVFISSVGAVGTRLSTAAPASPAPEKLLPLSDAPTSNGYARSKFLSELLCDTAARRLGIPITIARVGQVAGPVRRAGGGEWNRKEWLPSLVIGSLAMGCLPEQLGPQFSEIDWLPVDLLADVLADLATADQADSEEPSEPHRAQVYNLRNPHTTTWASLLPCIIETVKASRGPQQQVPKVVPPSAWLARLEAASTSADDAVLVTNPAIRLIDFYRDEVRGVDERAKTPPMAIERALARSEALRGVEGVGPEWMQRWVKEWMA